MNMTTIIIGLNIVVFIILIITLIHHNTAYKKIINVKEKYAPKINSNIKKIKNKIKKSTNIKLNKLKKELFKKDPNKYKIHKLKFQIDYTCDNCICFYREHVIDTGEIFNCCSKYNIKDNSLSDKKLRIKYCDKKYIDYKQPKLYDSSITLDPEISDYVSKSYTYWNKNKDFNNIQFDPNQKVIFTKNNPNLLIKEKHLLSVREAHRLGEKLRHFYDRDFKLSLNTLIEYLCIDYDINLTTIYSPEYNQENPKYRESFCYKTDKGWEVFIRDTYSSGDFNNTFLKLFSGIILNHELDCNNKLIEPQSKSIPEFQRLCFVLGFLTPKKIFIQKYYEFNGRESLLENYFETDGIFILTATCGYHIHKK